MNLLYELYRKGPTLNGFGFWGGKENNEICSLLTNVNNELWKSNQYECEILIQKHYKSFEICILFICTIIFVYKLLYFIFTYIFIVKPLISHYHSHQRIEYVHK